MTIRPEPATVAQSSPDRARRARRTIRRPSRRPPAPSPTRRGSRRPSRPQRRRTRGSGRPRSGRRRPGSRAGTARVPACRPRREARSGEAARSGQPPRRARRAPGPVTGRAARPQPARPQPARAQPAHLPVPPSRRPRRPPGPVTRPRAEAAPARGLGLRAALAERGPRRREGAGPDAPRGHRRDRRVRRRRAGRYVRTSHGCRRGLACGPQPGGLGWRFLDDRVERRLHAVARGSIGLGYGRVRRADRRADTARDGGEQGAALRAREAPIGHGLTASGADDRTFGHRSPRQPPRALGGPIACQTSGAGSSPHLGQTPRRTMAPASAARRASTPHVARRRRHRPGRGRRTRAPRTPRPT